MLKEGLRGAAAPKTRAHKARGTGSPAHVVVGAQGGLARGQQSPRSGHISVGGRGVLPTWWSVLKEGLRGG